ncbi:UDP-N-acetylmuramoylalanyl-D-glutamate--2,6-diaminopimelate ligase [hydrothermal vent metagenome]|uniref:UDP-N-acetylmuramoylalanyl-D-glutamate--2,6-diaminopimelate ligase n=1 Tax=hydrothermal vent metagenome TaxID=652676 RepID=A0A3B1E662_9ZZZZ
MILTKNNITYTDHSKNANISTTFITSKQNELFIVDAKKNGCQNFITSRELKNNFDFSTIKIIGITGTNGKTTTAAAIYSMLLDLNFKVALQGTRGFFINDTKIKKYSLTTPVQLENFSNIQKAVDNKCDFFVMEVSSHSIVQNRIEGLNFVLRVHTNITQDHLDYHKTIQEYIDIKNSFFSNDEPKLINKDDPKIKYKLKNAFSYGLDNNATYKVQAYSLTNGINCAIQHFNNMVNVSSSMIGVFNVYNLTAAIACVHILTNKPLQEICDTIENFGGVNGRMEIVNNHPLVIVDFAHTPDGMKKVFDSFINNNIIVVFGAGGNRDKTKRPLMGQLANDYAKHIIVTSDNPRFEDPDLIANDIVSSIADKSKIEIDLNRKSAISKAILMAEKIDKSVVLVLGKGDEEYQIIYDKKMPFSDKKIIKELTHK